MPVNDGPGRITTFKGHDNFKMGMAIKKESAIWMLTGTTLVGRLERAGGQGPQRRRQGRRDQGDPGPAQGRPGRQPHGVVARSEGREPVRGLLDPGRRDEAHARRSCSAGCSPPASTTRSPTRTSAARSTPRRRTSRCGQLRHDRRAASARTRCRPRSSATARWSRPRPASASTTASRATVKVGWAEAIGSAAGLTPGTAITVELYVGELDVKIVTVPFPFKSGGEVTPGTGKYKVSVSV